MNRFAALLGQRVRRDGVQLALWIIGIGLLALMSVIGVSESFGSEQERRALLAAALANPVILLFRGLPSGADEGAFIVFLILPFLGLLAALMSTFLAVRHTRGDEEAGRTELVAATPAGRVLPVAATATHGLIANVIVAVVVTLAYVAAGLGGDGALVVGLAASGLGITFLGVGLVAAQVMRTSRGANSLAVWITVGSLLIAGLGNAIGTPSDDLTRMESSWLAWLSPFGWAENTRAFDENAWGLALLCIVVGVLLIVVSVALAAVRDVGESFVAERRGHAEASALLSTPLGLVWRLSRGAILGWAIGGLIIGALATSLAGLVAEIGSTNPTIEAMLAQLGGDDIEQATVSVFFTMLGVLAACAAVQTIARARQEEAHGTAEPVLATPVARVRWLLDYLVVGAIAILAVTGAAVLGATLGVLRQRSTTSPTDAASAADLMPTVVVTAAGQTVAASVFLALTAVIFVIAPRLTIPLAWALVLVAMVLGLFGPLFGFPEWLTNLSPVAVAPHVESGVVQLSGLWWLVAVTVVGVVLALSAMRRRELAAAG